MTLTERRLNSLSPYIQEFYHQMPDGEHTVYQLSEIMNKTPESIGSILTSLRRKGLIRSQKVEGAPSGRLHTHIKLLKADQIPQGVLYHRGNGSVKSKSGNTDTKGIKALFDAVRSDLDAIEATVYKLAQKDEDIEDLKDQIQRLLG